MNIDHLEFDSQLFGLKIGKISLDDWDISDKCLALLLHGQLRHAFDAEFSLIYIFSPIMRVDNLLQYLPLELPGVNVDEKTVYKIRLLSLDNETLVKKVYLSFSFKIGTLKADTKVTNELENLAVMAGEWSRFSTDKNLPRNSLTLMYHSWLENSINRKLADEIFIATDPNSKSIIGFITVKQSVSDKYCVSIGLLSVSNEYRRQGIASALLSRAALWALEITGWSDQTFLSVVTQGANGPACSCYEKFGFLKDTIQYVYHAWLPQHLEEPLQRADHGKIPFCKQFLTGKEIENVSQVLASGLDSTSRFTHLCSKVLKEMLGHESKRVVIVPSGTSALEMAALLINIMPGDEIIMPSFTFSSTANAFVLRGGIPVFVDIRPDTLNINEKLIEEAITSRTVAICCVHYGGTPCDMDSICEIVSRHKLYLIEDAAQGFLSTYKGRMVGTIGHFGCFSFHYTKNIICGEGGALSINKSASTEMIQRALILWEKGTNRYDFMAGRIDKYEWIDVGSSYIPNEVSCAILLSQLQQALPITEIRLYNHARYRRGLLSLQEKGWIRLSGIPEYGSINGHIMYIILPSLEQRIKMEQELKLRGISSFSHYVPLHSSPAGKKYCKIGCNNMSVTQATYGGLLRLPVWVGLRDDQIDYVISSVTEICQNFNQV